jgi:hypothetical protein
MESPKLEIIVECPHCKDLILIEKINCSIFRHGVFKCNGKQLNPHAPKPECDLLFNKNLIYGCGKPFELIKKDDTFIAEICEYK